MDQTAIGPLGSHPAPSSHEILQEIWREIVRLDPEAVPVVAPPVSATATVPGTGARPGGHRASPSPVLPALLALDDAAFIAAAYDAILGRSPDEAGIASTQAALARGLSKVAVLGSLQRSPEARSTGRIVPGLRARAWVHGAYRLPVLGVLARFGSAILRRSGLRRGLARDVKIAALEARLESLESSRLQAGRGHAESVADQRARIDSLARKVAALVNEHALGFDRLARRVDAVSRHMAALDETLTDPLVNLADGLEAQRRAILQVKADLAAEQRRAKTMSDELRRTLEGTALPNLPHQVARQA